MSVTKFIGLAAVFAAAAPSLSAQNCNGKPGWVLTCPGDAPIGANIDVTMTGPANELAFYMVSFGQGPLQSGYGEICLDFPLGGAEFIPLGPTGTVTFTDTIPCDVNIRCVTLYMQFLTCRPNKGVSNQCSLFIKDGICPSGDMISYTADRWGETSDGVSNLGWRRDHLFNAVFPNGVTIGDADGVDGDGVFALHFDGSADIEAFLPNAGPAALLSGDATNPTSSGAGRFAGQLVTAKMNVGFDDAGGLNDLKFRDDVRLGDLVFVNTVATPLIGRTVRDVIDIADQAISGALGSGPLFDIDADSIGDVSADDLADALTEANNSYLGTNKSGVVDLP